MTASEIERSLTYEISPALNMTARVAGYPVSEFLLLSILCLVGLHASSFLGFGLFGAMLVVGRIRKYKPVNWLQLMPYLWIKLHYAYFLPPGKRTFLP